jgi:rSAM/selenodomain-associated transferase 2
MSLSIVIPVLNEAAGIAELLARLAPLRQQGAQVIVVDSGSVDGTAELARPLADLVLASEKGRARQMNAGAAVASGDALLFLHADTSLPEGAMQAIEAAPGTIRQRRFDVALDGRHPMLPVIAAMMSLRSRLTGIATGDQAIFVRRAAFEALGGFAPIALMEDIEFCRRAKRFGAPACLRRRVRTSGRRWERHGVWRTILLMWRLRLAYFLGADPKRLAVKYGYGP